MRFLQFSPPFWLASLVLLHLWASPGLPEEKNRFVHPDQAVTFVDPDTQAQIKVLIDQESVGTTQVTVAELLLPPGTHVPAHQHGSVEVFYVLSGELEQTIEGKTQKLTPGMSCLVPARTNTTHKVTSSEPVRALVIWVPGGEERRIVQGWQTRRPRPEGDPELPR